MNCDIVVGVFIHDRVSKEMRDFQRIMIDSFNTTTRNPSHCSSAKPILVQFVAGIPRSNKIINEDDIILLPIIENMNDGKTYYYFSSIDSTLENFNAKFAFKADDDTFVHYDNLYKDIEKFLVSDQLVYYGRIASESNQFMTGMLYGLSKPLIHEIMKVKEFASKLNKAEDYLTSEWVNEINKTLKVQYIDNIETFYDHLNYPRKTIELGSF